MERTPLVAAANRDPRKFDEEAGEVCRGRAIVPACPDDL
jgi:hypothetical protein